MAFEKIDAKQQRKIFNDWAALFPSYKKEGTSKVLSRRVGPIVLSIWYQMSRTRQEYYIRFTEFALLRENERPSSFLEATPSSRGDLPWIFHEQGIYKRLAQELRETAFVPIEGPVALSQVLKAYKKNLTRRGNHIDYYEDPALIAAWAERGNLAKELVEWAYEVAIDGATDEQYLKDMVGWKKSLEERIKNPERLREIVVENVEKLKLTKIPYEDLVIDC